MTEASAPKIALRKAVKIVGSQAALAAKIGAKQQYISYWINKGKRVPAEFVQPIAAATKDSVSAHDLRPDLFPPPAATGQRGGLPPSPEIPADGVQDNGGVAIDHAGTVARSAAGVSESFRENPSPQNDNHPAAARAAGEGEAA